MRQRPQRAGSGYRGDPGGAGPAGDGARGQRLANGAEVAALEARGIEVLVSTAAEGRRRTHDFRPAKALPAAREPKADWLKAGKLASEQGRALYKLRRQTVAGLRRHQGGAAAGFSLRGLDKVRVDPLRLQLLTS